MLYLICCSCFYSIVLLVNLVNIVVLIHVIAIDFISTHSWWRMNQKDAINKILNDLHKCHFMGIDLPFMLSFLLLSN